MRKVLLRLPDNVYAALKSDAAERGKSMNASAVELFSTFFELAASTSAQKSDSTSGDASTKSDSTSEKVLADSASASAESAITPSNASTKVDSTPPIASTKSDSTVGDASTKSDSTPPTASTILAQFASTPVVSPAVLAHLSEPDALSVEYVARAEGRWSNTP